MDPGLRTAAGLTIAVTAVLVLASPARAEPTPSVGPSTVVVPLPAGRLLAPGTYQVEITGPGTRIRSTLTIAPVRDAEAPPAARETGGGSGSDDRGTWLSVALGALLLATVGVLVYMRLWPPVRTRRAYHTLIAALSRGEHERAIAGLSALEPELPASLRSDAQFHVAFALYQRGELDEAEFRLAALHRAHPSDREIAHLLGYIRLERRDLDGADAALRHIKPTMHLDDGRDRKLLGVITYQRASRAFHDGDLDSAAALFQQVQHLGDFGDRIPADLRSRHLVLGTRALIESDLQVGRGHFEAVIANVHEVPPDGRNDALASAKLGLALVAWLDDGPFDPQNVDQLLSEAIRLLDPQAPLTLPWPVHVSEPGLDERLGLAWAGAPNEIGCVLRDMHFLRAMTFLRSARDGPDLSEPVRAARIEAATQRLACAHRLDAAFVYPYLVMGLLRYHLGGDAARAAAIGLLSMARRLGAHDPDVVGILNEHERRTGQHRDAVDAFLHLIDQYRDDPTVSERVRRDLAARLARHGRAHEWDTRPEPAGGDASAPSVATIIDRSDLLLVQVRLMLAARGDDESPVLGLAQRLAEQSRSLSEQARQFATAEAELLDLVGTALLDERSPDEEV